MAADVVVVGAGIAGLALASLLAPSRRVLVLERGLRPGLEASGQSAGLVRRLAEDPVDRALAVRTAAWLTELDDEPASTAVGAVLGLARDPTTLDDPAAHLRARGIAVEALDHPERVAPALAGAPLSAAWFLPEERVARVDVLLARWRREVEAHGGRIRCGTGVERIAVTGGRATGVVTEGGERIAAERIVLATGAWSMVLAARAGIERPLLPLRRTLVRTSAHALARPRHPWVWVDDVGLYARPDEGAWLVSGCDEAIEIPTGAPGSGRPAERAERDRVAAKLARWLPALSDMALEHGWSGLRTFAPDRRPLLGADGTIDGLWWIAGLGGAGVSGGFAAAEVVAAWMDGRTIDTLRHPALVAPSRRQLARWPIRPYGDSATAVLVDGTVPASVRDRPLV